MIKINKRKYKRRRVMDNFFRKSFLAGIGFLAATEEKCRENIESFVKKGELTEKEGKEIFDRFKERYKDFFKDIEKKIDIQVEKIIEKAGLVKAEDLEEIKKRLRAIEDKLEKSD